MRIVLLGDMALIGRASKKSASNWNDYFQDMAKMLGEADYVVGNLETPFSKKQRYWGAKSVYLCSEPENVEILKFLHVDAVTLANNHMYDYGKEAFELTQKLLDDSGISWFGINGKSHLLEKDENKIAFTGFCCYSTNPLKCVKYGKTGINEFDFKDVEGILSSYHKKGYLNICAIHAGIEHVNYPSLETIAVAKKLAQTGPMVYYGHHPHVAQTVVQEGKSVIAYSLGNFCFDDTYTKASGKKPLVALSEDNRKSFVLVLTVKDNTITNYSIVPIYIGKDKIHVGVGTDEKQLSAFQQKMESMSPEEYERMRMEQRQAWLKPRKDARDVNWYIKRLRFRYLQLVITNKLNSIKYRKHVSDYLKGAL